MQGLVAVLAPAAMARKPGAAAQATEAAAYSLAVLPPGIRSRFVNNINGLRMHVLEAGFEDKDRPAVLLLHGFPELAYSWRKVMRPIAAAGYHVIAPDVRPDVFRSVVMMSAPFGGPQALPFNTADAAPGAAANAPADTIYDELA